MQHGGCVQPQGRAGGKDWWLGESVRLLHDMLP